MSDLSHEQEILTVGLQAAGKDGDPAFLCVLFLSVEGVVIARYNSDLNTSVMDDIGRTAKEALTRFCYEDSHPRARRRYARRAVQE